MFVVGTVELSQQEQEIVDLLKLDPACALTAAEISRDARIPLSKVPPLLGELMSRGVLASVQEREYPFRTYYYLTVEGEK